MVSVQLEASGPRCLVITGPNMGGKSTLMRQVALIQIMAQIGCHVPADGARLGVCDAIHVRMGAHDDIMAGRSTFMVELSETAQILQTAGPRSLVLLDELGRGTSTHDGCAIAYAVLAQLVKARSLTLFSTHYPALTAVAEETRMAGLVANCYMSYMLDDTAEASFGPFAYGSYAPRQYPHASLCQPQGADAEADSYHKESNVTFLYRLVPGTSASFGLNVARLAGLPQPVLALAFAKAREMEANPSPNP